MRRTGQEKGGSITEYRRADLAIFRIVMNTSQAREELDGSIPY